MIRYQSYSIPTKWSYSTHTISGYIARPICGTNGAINVLAYLYHPGQTDWNPRIYF